MRILLITIQRHWLYFRLLRWAVVHSSNFHECSLCLEYPLITIEFFRGKYSGLLLEIRFYRPQVIFDIPYTIVESFVKLKNQEGESIKIADIDNIPF